jgi:hypothetical protein
MLARLGDVLYWLGCIAAVMVAIYNAKLWNEARHLLPWYDPEALLVGLLVVLVPAFVVWLIGRACRNVLGCTGVHDHPLSR